MRVTPSAVPDRAASVARHQYKRQRSVRVSLIQQDRRDIGRVRRGGWLLGRREPGQKMTLRQTCLSVPSSRASGEPGAPGTRGCLRTRRHGGVAESITRRWPGGAAQRSHEGLVVDVSPMRRQRCDRRPGQRWTPQSRGGHGRRWWCSRWGASGAVDWGQATGEPVHSRRGRRSPPVSRAPSGRPAVIDPTRRRSTAKSVSETMSRPLIMVLILMRRPD
jgi:hypothetical protein